MLEPLTATALLAMHIEGGGKPVHVNTIKGAIKRAGFVWKRTRSSLKNKKKRRRLQSQADRDSGSQRTSGKRRDRAGVLRRSRVRVCSSQSKRMDTRWKAASNPGYQRSATQCAGGHALHRRSVQCHIQPINPAILNSKSSLKNKILINQWVEIQCPDRLPFFNFKLFCNLLNLNIFLDE